MKRTAQQIIIYVLAYTLMLVPVASVYAIQGIAPFQTQTATKCMHISNTHNTLDIQQADRRAVADSALSPHVELEKHDCTCKKGCEHGSCCDHACTNCGHSNSALVSSLPLKLDSSSFNVCSDHQTTYQSSVLVDDRPPKARHS